jgi:hypothetical protein
MQSVVAEHNIGVEPCRREVCGDMLEAMARIASSQPSEAVARTGTRRDVTISLDPSYRVKIPE